MTQVTLHRGDCRDVLRRLKADGVQVHSVVCDPPYYLESVVRRFGKPGAAPAKFGSDGAFARQSKGFMGKTWDGAEEDGTRIAQDPEFWGLVYDVLLPGGYVLAFSSPRTGHWQACAMELAGFVMHPFIGWAYGQGFPKAHNASKAIDRELGTSADRKTVVELYRAKRIQPGATNHAEGGYGKQDEDFTATVSRRGSPAARQWDGWAYGAQAMKPALEPIYVGQKPFSEKNGALNLLKHGVGAMNIDGCRVEVRDVEYARNCSGSRGHGGTRAADEIGATNIRAGGGKIAAGRHPANLIHDGSPDVIAMFPADAGAAAPVRGDEPSAVTKEIFGKFNARVPSVFHGDSGSAARFFNAFPIDETGEVWADDLAGDPVIYAAKASSKDRIFKCTSCGQRYRGKRSCDCVGDDGKPAKVETHPTVKPVSMMQWLCRLVTPPGGIVLDPFAGSGTTGEAARKEGFSAILIEREQQYSDDIAYRLQLSHQLPQDVRELLGLPILGTKPAPSVEILLGQPESLGAPDAISTEDALPPAVELIG